jgi:hypothetical protein
MKWYLLTLSALPAMTTLPMAVKFHEMVLANFQAIADALDFAARLHQ